MIKLQCTYTELMQLLSISFGEFIPRVIIMNYSCFNILYLFIIKILIRNKTFLPIEIMYISHTALYIHHNPI